MREIKFRGKSKLVIEELEELCVEHSNGWVYGNLVMYRETPYIARLLTLVGERIG